MLPLIIAIVALSIVLLAAIAKMVCLNKELCQARKGDRMKTAFLENISHEIRTPLKVLNESADILSREDLYLSKTEKRNISEQLQFNSNLIGTLLDEALVFTDSKAGNRQVSVDTFSPNAVCRRCLEAHVHSIYHQQAVRLNFKRELSDEFFVKTDCHLLELILNKLILNACRFTEEGEVVVGCNTSEHVGRLTFFVCDTGVGIPDLRRNHLFSWFEAPESMADEAELDLSICQKLAQKLGGVMEIDERHQNGTRVVLILPLEK